jgi:hypothetical protein
MVAVPDLIKTPLEPPIASSRLGRRDFIKIVGSASAGVACGAAPWLTPAFGSPSPSSAAETAVKGLWESLTVEQRKEICFDWDYCDAERGLVRTFVANHWQVTRPCIRSEFFTKKQQLLIHDIFKSLINPDWYSRFMKQLRDDTYGHEWGTNQSVAIFGTPGSSKFEFIITGRHLTLRADGHSEGRVAFGGPIFYGHAASGYTESVHHPGNVFWPQALKANKVYQMLDGKQRSQSLLTRRPAQEQVAFRTAPGQLPGIPVAEMSSDQKNELREVLQCLIEPFRKEDQDGALECLQQQGGLDHCSLAFYQESDLGNDGEWDNWRLEGPAFVWYFRGTPHVHVWVHVANDPSVALNAKDGMFIDPSHDPLQKP